MPSSALSTGCMQSVSHTAAYFCGLPHKLATHKTFVNGNRFITAWFSDFKRPIQPSSSLFSLSLVCVPTTIAGTPGVPGREAAVLCGASRAGLLLHPAGGIHRRSAVIPWAPAGVCERSDQAARHADAGAAAGGGAGGAGGSILEGDELVQPLLNLVLLVM